MTLKDAIAKTKCRTGKADGTTKQGAYWLACQAIPIRSFGGDGIGNNRPDMTAYLELRHYRDGEIRARVHVRGFHQNRGECFNSYIPVDLNDCKTAEDVIVRLKGIRDNDRDEAVYSDSSEERLTAALRALGLPEAAPGPDGDE